MSEATIAERLLYRDGLMLVLDKPAGIAVHKGPISKRATQGICLEDVFGGLRFGLPRDPGLAHRLDRDTSGCLVLGRHRKALEALGTLFKQGKVGKTYWAVVEGEPEADEGLIDLPLGRLDRSIGWWMKVDPFGQPSQSRWRVLARGAGHTALALEPLTGRTHQLRVHCAAMGWPIRGDRIYGTGGVPMHLHARTIRVPLYRNRDPIEVEAPLPDHMTQAWTGLGLALPPGSVEPRICTSAPDL